MLCLGLWLAGSASLASSGLSSCECNFMGLRTARLYFLCLDFYNGVLPHRLNLLEFFQDRDNFSLVRGILWGWNS